MTGRNSFFRSARLWLCRHEPPTAVVILILVACGGAMTALYLIDHPSPKTSVPDCGSAASNQLVLQMAETRTPMLLDVATAKRERQLINSGPAHIAEDKYMLLGAANATTSVATQADIASAYEACMRPVRNAYALVPSEVAYYAGALDCAQKRLDAEGKERDRLKAAVAELDAMGSSEDIGKASDAEAAQIKQSLANAEAAATYSLNTIRWTGKNRDTGALTCAAKLKVRVSGYGEAEVGITYTMQKTTDGKDYVDVQGLR